MDTPFHGEEGNRVGGLGDSRRGPVVGSRSYGLEGEASDPTAEATIDPAPNQTAAVTARPPGALSLQSVFQSPGPSSGVAFEYSCLLPRSTRPCAL